MTVKYFYLEGFFKVVNKIQMGLTTQNFLLFLSLLISNTFKKGKKKKVLPVWKTFLKLLWT